MLSLADRGGFWWFLRQLWPRKTELTVWAALLFLVYPGFKQQFIAINSSRHILPLAFFLLSLGLMVLAVRRDKQRLWSWVRSGALALLAMFSTEYYFGLELVRPVVLWLALAEEERDLARHLRRTLTGWAGFLALLALLFAWRYSLSKQINYPVTLTSQLAADPWGTLLMLVKTVLLDGLEVTFGAWAQVFRFPACGRPGPDADWNICIADWRLSAFDRCIPLPFEK